MKTSLSHFDLHRRKLLLLSKCEIHYQLAVISTLVVIVCLADVSVCVLNRQVILIVLIKVQLLINCTLITMYAELEQRSWDVNPAPSQFIYIYFIYQVGMSIRELEIICPFSDNTHRYTSWVSKVTLLSNQPFGSKMEIWSFLAHAGKPS